MKYSVRLSVLLFVFAFAGTAIAGSPEPPTSSPSGSQRQTAKAIPGVLIIKFKEQVSFKASGTTVGVAAIDPLLEGIGTSSVEPMNPAKESALQKAARPAYNIDRMVVVRYTSGDNPVLLANMFSADANVEYAEPYYSYSLTLRPNDPRLGQQWAVNMMKLPEAWDVTTGDSTIVIADVDSGVDYTHEDLKDIVWVNPGEWGTNGELKDNNIDDDGNGYVDDWRGWDFIGNGSGQSPLPDNDPMDGSIGHGTNTSGCAAAQANNGIGIAGSSYKSRILAVKTGSNTGGTIDAGYQGIIYAGQMGARVINCSWGGPSISQAMQDIINDVSDMGALVVTSAGNDPVDNDYILHNPGALDRVLNVGSIENTGNPSMWATYGNSVHTYAPGSGILTTRRGGSYTSPTGTSFSSPLAAGVAALVFSVHPDWTPEQVATQIRVTSDPFDTPVTSKRFGRINAFRAVSENATLSDIPGIRLKSYTIQVNGALPRFTEPGQQARVTAVFENVLAPTSDQAIGTVDPDDPSISAPEPVFSLGSMNTFDTREITFSVNLSMTPSTSEGYVPVRIRIEDGAYTDFALFRIPIYLSDAWHTSADIGSPTIQSVSSPTVSACWAAFQNNNADVMLRTVNSGGSWAYATGSGYPNGQGVYCVTAVSNTSALVGTGPSNGAAKVFRTTNSGNNWTGVDVSGITGFVNWIHMFDENNGILQGDPKNNVWGIATTTDGGETWTPISTPLSAASGEAGWNNSFAAWGDTLWFGTNSSKIYRSTDRGLTWSSYPTPTNHSIGMAFGDGARGIAYFNEQTDKGGANMIATTTDGGETWTELKTIEYIGGTVEMEPDGKRTWLMQGRNAYVSRDLGQTWTVQATPASLITSRCSDIWTNNTLVDVWSAGWSIYKYRSSYEPLNPPTDAAFAPAIDGFGLTSVYPHPVSSASGGNVTVGFTLPRAAGTSLQVYDNLGRMVRTAFSGQLAAGDHSFSMQLGGLPVGTYHLRLAAGARSMTRTLQIIH